MIETKTLARQSPHDLEAESLSRELSRSSLIDFTTYTYPTYKAEPFHICLSGIIQTALKTPNSRTMIFAPPQHGKSELISVRAPAWWLGNNPKKPVIICSYGALLANSKATQARSIIGSDLYQNIFPEITEGAEGKQDRKRRISGIHRQIISAGVGGAITGFGAYVGIIDDPIKNWQEAQSENTREKVWDWYRSTFRTRIWEGGSIILVMTRWHEDDLAGRLLKEQAEFWKVVRFPALSETQEDRDTNNKYIRIFRSAGLPDPLERKKKDIPLCPIRFPLKNLKATKVDVGSIVWTAEYQGVPRAPEGNWFKRAWFRTIYKLPRLNSLVLLRYWDKAATQGGGAYTTGLLMARSKVTGRFIIIDIVRGKWSTYNRERVMRTTALRDYERFGRVLTFLEIEPGSGGIDSYRASVKNLAGFTVKSDRPTGDKLTRLQPFHAQAEALNVVLLHGDWNEEFLDEITAVPNNTYWDQADGTSGAFNRLSRKGWARGMGS